tara:strand:- start:633 stop:794 length:162 start_codon:yes stop_codon:yes gene_type:complete
MLITKLLLLFELITVLANAMLEKTAKFAIAQTQNATQQKLYRASVCQNLMENI